MNINPGRFNRKITIQKYTISSDSIGNQKATWADYKTVYADINGLYGQDYWAAAAQGQENTINFTIRWSKSLEQLAKDKDFTLYRIVFDGNIYSIKDYDNVDFANVIIKIKAVSK